MTKEGAQIVGKAKCNFRVALRKATLRGDGDSRGDTTLLWHVSRGAVYEHNSSCNSTASASTKELVQLQTLGEAVAANRGTSRASAQSLLTGKASPMSISTKCIAL
jgi:hypothetical protein